MVAMHLPRRMYRLLNKAIEELSPARRGPDLRVDVAAFLSPDAEPQSWRSETIPSPVSLTESIALSPAAFEMRWTSLSA